MEVKRASESAGRMRIGEEAGAGERREDGRDGKGEDGEGARGTGRERERRRGRVQSRAERARTELVHTGSGVGAT